MKKTMKTRLRHQNGLALLLSPSRQSPLDCGLILPTYKMCSPRTRTVSSATLYNQEKGPETRSIAPDIQNI